MDPFDPNPFGPARPRAVNLVAGTYDPFRDFFVAEVTAGTLVNGLWLYTWAEQTFDPVAGTFTAANPGRTGTYTAGSPAVYDSPALELNNTAIDLTNPIYVFMRQKGFVGGIPYYEFEYAAPLTVTDGTNTVLDVTKITFSGATVGGTSPDATVTVSGGGSLTVKDVTGTPSYGSTTTIETVLADGLQITQPSAGTVKIDSIAATATQQGTVSTTTQTFAGVKTFTSQVIGDTGFLAAGDSSYSGVSVTSSPGYVAGVVLQALATTTGMSGAAGIKLSARQVEIGSSSVYGGLEFHNSRSTATDPAVVVFAQTYNSYDPSIPGYPGYGSGGGPYVTLGGSSQSADSNGEYPYGFVSPTKFGIGGAGASPPVTVTWGVSGTGGGGDTFHGGICTALGSGGTGSITGLISAGTNVTITGLGTSGSPYVISSSGGGGSGTVTSVAAAGPSGILTWSPAVTTSGTLTATLATQSANTVFAGPSSGGSAAPTFRALVAADVPALPYDRFASLAYTPISVSSSVTLTANKWHIVTAAAAVTLTLPSSPAAGTVIGVVIDSSSSKLVTVSGTINGVAGKILWAGETFEAEYDGSKWRLISCHLNPMVCCMYCNGAVAVNNNRHTLVPLTTTQIDNTGLMADTTTGVINVVRPGNYVVTGAVTINSNAAGSTTNLGYGETRTASGANELAFAAVTLFAGLNGTTAVTTGVYAIGATDVDLYAYHFTGVAQTTVGGSIWTYLHVTELPAW